jgi:hypothetical protein
MNRHAYGRLITAVCCSVVITECRKFREVHQARRCSRSSTDVLVCLVGTGFESLPGILAMNLCIGYLFEVHRHILPNPNLLGIRDHIAATFSGAFTTLRKPTVSSAMSVRPHGTTRLPPYGLTPWSRGLLEKLTVSQQVKKFPVCYGTRRFITAFTTARHLFLS